MLTVDDLANMVCDLVAGAEVDTMRLRPTEFAFIVQSVASTQLKDRRQVLYEMIDRLPVGIAECVRFAISEEWRKRRLCKRR